MEIIKRTNIVVKTARRFVVRRAETDEPVQCGQCGGQMTDTRNLDGILDVSLREVFRLVEADKIHFYESAERIGFICLKSLGALSLDAEQPEIVNTESRNSARFFK